MRVLFRIALLAMLAACGNGSGKSSTSPDAFQAPDVAYFPDVPLGCPPGTPNDLGVGKTCTKRGNECVGNGKANLCTCDGALGIDPPVGTPCFCTIAEFTTACSKTINCGNKASCCTLLSVVSGCVPEICLTDNECPIVAH